MRSRSIKAISTYSGSFMIFNDTGYSFRRGFTFHGLAEFLEFSFSYITAKSVILGLVRTKLTPVLIKLCVSSLPQFIFDPSFSLSKFRAFPRRISYLVRNIILLTRGIEGGSDMDG